MPDVSRRRSCETVNMQTGVSIWQTVVDRRPVGRAHYISDVSWRRPEGVTMRSLQYRLAPRVECRRSLRDGLERRQLKDGTAKPLITTASSSG